MPKLPPNPSLSDLDVFIGRWRVEVPQFSGQAGEAVFEWLEGGAFLRFHAAAPDPAPSATLIITRDENSTDYTVCHYDSRGVSRVYQMSFDGSIWRIWRNAPGFSQRFHGRLSEDRRSIQATWEKSRDGSIWEHDFDLAYGKIS